MYERVRIRGTKPEKLLQLLQQIDEQPNLYSPNFEYLIATSPSIVILSWINKVRVNLLSKAKQTHQHRSAVQVKTIPYSHLLLARRGPCESWIGTGPLILYTAQTLPTKRFPKINSQIPRTHHIPTFLLCKKGNRAKIIKQRYDYIILY